MGEPVSFSAFVEMLRRAPQVADARSAEAAALDERRRHLLDVYAGVDVARSFQDARGHVFDCVPLEAQPALRGGRVARPPRWRARPVSETPARRAVRGPTALPGLCPEGCVPLRRITLEEIGRFRTIRHYHRKRGHGRLGLREDGVPAAPESRNDHVYAIGRQVVANVGGRSTLSVAAPTVPPGDTFSLSQQWYVARTPSGLYQTIEVGWQVAPGRYGHPHPVLFTYWTADSYDQTGSYDGMGGHFVVTSQKHAPGRVLASAGPAAPMEIDLGVVLHESNWWIFVDDEPMGYYPCSLFGDGPLAVGATTVEFGGETQGDGSYPPMGNGAFASASDGAAYHRHIQYYTSEATSFDATLSAREDWPEAYTVVLGRNARWGVYASFGGPGRPSI